MSSQENVPAFLMKLWKLVEDGHYDDLICWSENGQSFIIRNQSQFSKELLPLYFKHSNLASFVRQLNMYGFRKVSSIEHSGLHTDRDEIEFYHPFFVKGHEQSLERIKRKASAKSLQLQVTNNKNANELSGLKHDEMSDILSDVKAIRGKQESVDKLLTTMRTENEALWREVAILRQKHLKQQQIVEKLIQCLFTCLHANRFPGVKRKTQLMINAKDDANEGTQRKVRKGILDALTSGSDGPVIHDITDDTEGQYLNFSNCASPFMSQASEGMSPLPKSIINEIIENSATETKLPFQTTETEPIGSLPILDPLQESLVEADITFPSDNILSLNEPENVTVPMDSLSLLRPSPESLNTPPGSPSTHALGSTAGSSNQNIPQNQVKDLVVANDPLSNSMTSYSDTLYDQIDGIETELDWLQEQLNSGGLNFDPSVMDLVLD